MAPPPRPNATVTQGRALLVSQHARIVGGGEISLLTLIKGLSARAWQPTLVVPKEGEVSRAAAALQVPVRCVEMPTVKRPKWSIVRAVRTLRSVVTEMQPDVVHANGTRALFYGALAARATGCPAVWHLRIIDSDRLFDPFLVRLAQGFVATSEAARSRLRRWPEAWRDCRVIPNGLDLAAFAAQRPSAAVRASLGLAEDDLVVVSTGRLVDFKRFDLLLDAVATLRPRLPRLRCVIVGAGPRAGDLRSRARCDDLRDAVLFTGERDDVADLLAAADVFVLTSPVESFARVVIEAMAMALPVIAPNAGGAAEIVVDEDTGLLIEPDRVDALAEALERLCNDRERRSRFGVAGRRRVEERYSMDRHACEMITLYDDLRGRSRRSP
jgi:glycosyltransferase involved in cell wall biosynthesis